MITNLARTLLILVPVILCLDIKQARPATPQDTRPNIVLIMCDDMGYSDIGCYGGEVQTPNLDRLARKGMRFRQFYNNAKCTTTRASILTGLFPRRSGGLLNKKMVTLGEVLSSAGYQTSLSGKWHLGTSEVTHPYKRGFSEFYGLLDGCCNFFDPSIRDPKYKGSRVRVFGRNNQRITEFPADFYTTDAFTDHAIECIQKFSDNKKPFFAHVCYTAPHYPLHAKPADIAKYRGKYKMGWEQLRKQRFSKMKSLGVIDDRHVLTEIDSKSYDWENSNQDWEDHRMAVYAAMIDSMDQNIGRILFALKETGVAENTLVLFLSDNGGCSEEPGGRTLKHKTPKLIPGPKEYYTAVGPAWGWAQNAPYKRYKSWCFEGGIKTPMIAYWPRRIPANTFSNQVGHIIDLMPTFLELAGTGYPTTYGSNRVIPVDGVSLVKSLTQNHVFDRP
ncbi:MAG: arylsulfatase, partial [Planctomycetota bacterium]|nr:arylsulfatase [Planctomycetota bacterium]